MAYHLDLELIQFHILEVIRILRHLKYAWKPTLSQF